MLYPGISRDENLCLMLADLRQKGIFLHLAEDGQTFTIHSQKGALTPELKMGIEVCRDGLLRALRLAENLCIECGQFPIKPMRTPHETPNRYCADCLHTRLWDNYTRLTGHRKEEKEKKNVRRSVPTHSAEAAFSWEP